MNVVAEMVCNEVAPLAVRLLTKGDATKFIIGLFIVPPVVVFDPG